MTIYQAEEEWHTATRSALYATLEAAKESYREADPVYGVKKDVQGVRILEWVPDGDAFRLVAIHYPEGDGWIRNPADDFGGPLERSGD